VSFPAGAAEELQEALPPERVAVHSDVVPVLNVTEPVGVGYPKTLVVTAAE
jgi:hypothetical protein